MNKVIVKIFSFLGNFFSPNASEDPGGAIAVLKNPAPRQLHSSKGSKRSPNLLTKEEEVNPRISQILEGEKEAMSLLNTKSSNGRPSRREIQGDEGKIVVGDRTI
ncbi:hypothetical protein JJD41_19770 [Oxynema sp. CENA135]|uniref:hypothetical protein n=1 Tax=Oxynema sp. CENA135 TaxID=984206 RepID=UPI001909B0BD|nr:hypothetical protein [Oxynema sp. CENA135]MBK4732090.1 hypothetical protein [Oxynema sp. CENA135]